MQVAELVDKHCVAVAINGHMLHWLQKTDGENGEFIKANRHPSGGNCFVLATPDGQKLAGGNGSGGASAALKDGLANGNSSPTRTDAPCPPARPSFQPKPCAARRRRAAWCCARTCGT
jgi:hypothetical protein